MGELNLNLIKIKGEINMRNNATKRIVYSAIIAAIYAALTLFLAPISFGPVQLRLSEVMVLLAIFDPLYIIGLTLGCFIANIFGSGVIDAMFGTLATFISVVLIYFTGKLKIRELPKLFIASIWPVIINGLIIGWMISHFFTEGKESMWILGGQVAIGEFVAVSIIGVYVFYKFGDKIKRILSLK